MVGEHAPGPDSDSQVVFCFLVAIPHTDTSPISHGVLFGASAATSIPRSLSQLWLRSRFGHNLTLGSSVGRHSYTKRVILVLMLMREISIAIAGLSLL